MWIVLLLIGIPCLIGLAICSYTAYLWIVDKKVRNNLENNPEFSSVKLLKEYMENSNVFWRLIRKNRRSYESWNAYYKDFEQNGKTCSEIIRNGAKILLVSGLRPDYPNKWNEGYFAITDKAIITRKKDGATGAKSVTVESIKSAIIKVHTTHNRKTVTTTKKASVTGQAVAGAVVAGGVGAVVGAVNALDTNLNGGKTKVKVVDGDEQICSIMFNGEVLDAIIISKDLIAQYGEPSVKYTPTITDDCWIYTGIPSFNADIANKNNFDAMVAYIQKLINEIQK